MCLVHIYTLNNYFSTYIKTLTIYRNPTEKAEKYPVKLLQSPNCNQPDITIKTPAGHSRSRTTDGTRLSTKGREYSPGKCNGIVRGTECLVVNGKDVKDDMEEGKIPLAYGSKFSCQWIQATVDDGQIHRETRDAQNEEETRRASGGSEPKDEENTERKLYKIANELLQTERAYVARLHLLDRVSAGLHLFSVLLIKMIDGLFSKHSKIIAINY